MLQGPYSNLERDRLLVRIPFTYFAVGTVLLPFGGLLICLAVTLMYHYSDATYTHCEVRNYLPSISSAISRVPERYIWRGFIGLHSAPRYLVSAAYFSFYHRHFHNRMLELLLSGLTLLLSLTENTGLLVLTYVGSTETYKIHKYGFITFIGSSLLHMLTTLRLWFVIQRHSLHSEEVTSYRWKRRLFLFNIICCVCAFYFFRRHNEFCEHGVYTLFALFEYLVVFSNMAFHITAFWDFRSKEVMVATPAEDKRY
ncbi:post-GPI attachment to proteins factor 2 [Periophthalmus magnuspinnatus]|uniref:Acyltransferase PGAP2 n=1 Tax=Periophthalmus magnuspinnatus TaxID=409849 RepID=A0A3B4ADM5_9GOBI|nr:post-GPI attachment to proteins factor 2 [Periophthalmus magnuspinnatus]